MEEATEETSRVESGHIEPQKLNGEGVIVKREGNHDERPRFFAPTEGSSQRLNADTMEPNRMAAQTFVVPQNYVDETAFTGDVERTEGKCKRRSEVWKDFTEDKKPDGSAGARCKRCNILLSATTNSGTSHLNRHIKLHCARKQYRDVGQMLLYSSSRENSGDSSGFRFNLDASRKKLAKLMICAELPFNIVDQPAFVDFVKSIQPLFQFGAQETVRHDCVVLYEEERVKIHTMLKNLNSRVSLTFDIWTSDQNVAYMALNAHFIDDDFVLSKKMLNFKRITCPLTSYAINEEIAKCIVGWDLVGKVFAVTFAGSRTHDILAIMFKETWSEKLFDNGNYLHLGCCANALNSMIEDGLKALQFTADRIRDIVKHVAATPYSMQAFNESAQQCGIVTTTGLILDVSTKWNGTYSMLQNALFYRDAFIKYAQAHYQRTDTPRHDDWEKLDVMMKFLEPFVNAIDVFSRTKYPTANLYIKELWTIWHLLQNEVANCDETVRNLTSEMVKRLQSYWSDCNMILAIASVLDPRFKLLFIEYCYENAFGEDEAKKKVTEIRDCLYKLYNHYEKAPNAKKHATSEESSTQGLGVSSVCSSTVELSFKRKCEMEFAVYLAQNRLKRSKRNELDVYLDDNVLPNMEDVDFSVLSWWKKSAELYPVLSRMARDVLAIPVSTFIYKSAFDACRRLIERSRISLDSSFIETFICAQDWFHDDCHADADGICDIHVTKFPDVDASNSFGEEIF